MTKKFTKSMLAYVGGTFYGHPFDPEFDISEMIIEEAKSSSEQVLEETIEFCDILLDKKLTIRQRQKMWVDALGEQWDLTPRSVSSILNFLRKENQRQLNYLRSKKSAE